MCLAALSPPTGAARAALMARVRRAIEPFDIAGLRETARRDWYPATSADLVRAASKLCASEGDVRAMLARCGLVDVPVA